MQLSNNDALRHVLYEILSNEDVIPTAYVHATDFISAMNDTMGGFGAHKNML